MDFEQLAFIEKWRQRAVRGAVVALDATGGAVLLTLRVGELGETMDLRARDETGAVRKQRASLGDRLFVAFRYRASEVKAATGASTSRTVARGAELEGILRAAGELHEVDLGGASILIEGDELAAFPDETAIRFRIADDGHAYVIPTR